MKTMIIEVNYMELAKITSKGQITLPIGLRRSLNLKDGGKVAFIEQDGVYTVVNPLMLAIENAQKAFEGEAERLGLKTEEDVVALVKEVRKDRWEKRHANND
jgi:AbrB family looped-hinge helix DNA binding protein